MLSYVSAWCSTCPDRDSNQSCSLVRMSCIRWPGCYVFIKVTSTVKFGEESELSKRLVEKHFADFVVLIVSVCNVFVGREQHVHDW